MIQPEDFRYSLVIDKKEYILPHSPSGWEESLLNWERSNDLFGMIRTFSVPMVFVLDGAWLLRGQFYEHGIKSETIIRIDQLNRATWQYVNMYTGEIDYSTFTDRMHEVEVSVMEGGISKMIKAYEKVQYEIPLDDPEAITVIIPGIGLVETAVFLVAANNIGYGSTHFDGGILTVPGLSVIANNLENQFVVIQDVEEMGLFGQNQLENPDTVYWFARADQDTNIGLKGTMKLIVDVAYSGQTIFIQVRNNSNEIVATLAHFIYTGTRDLPVDIEIDFSSPISSGERWFLVTGVTGEFHQGGTSLEIVEADFNLSNSLITEDTTALAFRPYTLLQRLLAKMNNGFAVNSQSYLLNSANWRRLIITSGDAIRQLPDPQIKTSFRDFFDSMNAVIGVGFGVENGTAVLEEKAYFMRKGLQAVHIGEVKEFNLELATNFIYNSIKVGYPNFNYEVEYGRDEYNSSQIWSTPITRVQRELNLLSKYRGDQLGIEDLRITPIEENENQTDNSSDNDVFMIKIQATPVDGSYNVEGAESYKTIKGVIVRNSYYNLDITPKKNLIRHGNFLRSMLHHYDGQHIRFESAEKNQTLETIDLDNNKVKENEWLPISSLGDRLFLPYIATVTSSLPKNTAELITNFPTGYIGFRYMGHEYKGFIMSASVDVARNSEREFKLLMTPDNNLLNLVH